MSTSRNFTGKVALVTGSTSGIGEEIAIQYAKYGANVVITGRGEDKIAAVVEKCNRVSPKKLKALGVKCDMSNPSEIRELVNKVINTLGGVDILVNNAGIFHIGFVSDPTFMDNFDAIISTNLRAPFLLTHLLAPNLIQSKGNIINISSVTGIHPSDSAVVYSSAKAALDMFTKCLTIDLGPKGVRVNSINPSIIRTPIFETAGMGDITELLENKRKNEYPLGRIGEVEDVAKFVLFLSSDDASFITGLVGPVDGGCLLTMTGKL
jgi:NAD(P)-dependent dehydrogenase (short-subunit alcohol dehydrogenase family)